MLKDWGSDLVLFFSYNRINAALSNPVFEGHVEKLFGNERVVRLREMAIGMSARRREALVLEESAAALGERGFQYVIPFTFKRPDMERTSHHLIFVTKNVLAYTVMKQIMAKESSEFEQGVLSFGYAKALSEYETPLLFQFDRPIEELGEMLLEHYAGRTLPMREVFEGHHVGRRYIERNYKAALLQLEKEGKITADPSAAKRRPHKGQPSFWSECARDIPAEIAMANNSAIEWTQATWNPIAGCTVLSFGCTNCYAMRLASRLAAMGQGKYRGTTRISGGRPKWNGSVNLDPPSLDLPRRWTKGRLIFVNSMSDLFHEKVPLEFIQKVFATMNETPQHTYQVLTKRADRLEELSPMLRWGSNIWMGMSVEGEHYVSRIGNLRRTRAKTKFLSLEPLLGPLDDLDLNEIDWVIVGGESGPSARPMKCSWVRSIRDRCVAEGVAFHFKQWGGTNKKAAGRVLDGRTWDEWPMTKTLSAARQVEARANA
jgi:protein gp37